MKGNIDNFKQQIVDFFKEKHINVNVISEDFESHSKKSEQCKISIVLEKKITEKIVIFELIAMPGCCGIVISTNCWVLHKLRGCCIGQFLHKLRIEIAKHWGYSILMCTDVSTNKIQNHILAKNNWKQLQNFINKRTENSVNINTLIL